MHFFFSMILLYLLAIKLFTHTHTQCAHTCSGSQPRLAAASRTALLPSASGLAVSVQKLRRSNKEERVAQE